MAREPDTERRLDTPEPETLTPPDVEQVAAEATAVAQAGPVPPVAQDSERGGGGRATTASEQAYGDRISSRPEIDANEKKMGEAMVNRMNEVNGIGGAYDLDHGVHYAHNYQRECREAGQPDRWKPEYRAGYQASGLFEQPFDTGSWYDFKLKKGESASKAVQAWLHGLTVAECFTAVVAMQYDTIRRAIGDKKFDEIFGSSEAAVDATVDADDRLRISMESNPVEKYTKPTKLAEKGTATDKELDKHLKPGEWYYFYNHPKYLLKHPDGAWQGENSLYMGKNRAGERLWSGMGASNKTEDQMFDSMVSSYNASRDAADEAEMKRAGIKNDDGTYDDARYDPASGEFKDTITKADVLNDPPYEIDGTTRKGGFVVSAGVTFDHKKVKKERDRKSKDR